MGETADAFDPANAAAVLADAWRRGTLLADLPEAIRPRTMAQGYDVQDRLMAELGQTPVGWKLGVGSARQKRRSVPVAQGFEEVVHPGETRPVTTRTTARRGWCRPATRSPTCAGSPRRTGSRRCCRSGERKRRLLIERWGRAVPGRLPR